MALDSTNHQWLVFIVNSGIQLVALPPVVSPVRPVVDIGASAASTARSTCAGCNSSRHLLKLPICRSHPSFWHGRQDNGCCTSQTFLRRWIVSAASHMGASPPTDPRLWGPVPAGGLAPMWDAAETARRWGTQ